MALDYFVAAIKGGVASGTMFLIGFVDFRYANTAFSSSSVICLYICQGIGGNSGLEVEMPLNFPSRIADKIISCQVLFLFT
jgi:hypothetical protein